MIYIYIIFFNLLFNQVYFTDLPEETGVYQPIIIEQCVGLDIGDEIGLFDEYGLISSDCSDQIDEILVGSGVYNGEQILISGIGSFDFCDLTDGFQMPGWRNNNSIKIKVWDSSHNTEYSPEVNYITGDGSWGDIMSVIDTLTVHELSIGTIDDFSLLNLYPNPFNNSITFNIDYNDNLNISIYSLTGKNIFNIDYNHLIDKNTFVWDASNYDSGIYLVKFYGSNLNLTKKITLIK